MPDFKNSKIYKLWCHETDEIYIGSTTQILSQRLSGHKTPSNKCNSKILFAKSNNVKIELLQSYPCENKDQLNKKEGEYIRKLKVELKKNGMKTILNINLNITKNTIKKIKKLFVNIKKNTMKITKKL